MNESWNAFTVEDVFWEIRIIVFFSSITNAILIMMHHSYVHLTPLSGYPSTHSNCIGTHCQLNHLIPQSLPTRPSINGSAILNRASLSPFWYHWHDIQETQLSTSARQAPTTTNDITATPISPLTGLAPPESVGSALSLVISPHTVSFGNYVSREGGSSWAGRP